VAMDEVALRVRRYVVPATENVRQGRLRDDVGLDPDRRQLTGDEGQGVDSNLTLCGAHVELDFLAALGKDPIRTRGEPGVGQELLGGRRVGLRWSTLVLVVPRERAHEV